MPTQDTRLARAQLSARHRVFRAVWNLVWLVLFRPSPRSLHSWRALLLQLFGATVGRGVHVYPSARVWAPWNLTIEEGACLADWVNCYSVAPIFIGRAATVSQYSYLCAASHDYNDPDFPLVVGAIAIKANAWIAADVFVGPGVVIEEGAVVLARATVVKNVEEWVVVAGNPSKVIAGRARHGT